VLPDSLLPDLSPLSGVMGAAVAWGLVEVGVVVGGDDPGWLFAVFPLIDTGLASVILACWSATDPRRRRSWRCRFHSRCCLHSLIGPR